MSKYFQLFLYSFLDNGKNRKELYIRCSFFFVILYIFSNLWATTSGIKGDFQHSEMIWYVYMTETIIISLPIIQFEIESDIRSGDVAYYLIKPINYLFFKISENLGIYHFRFLVLLIFGFVCCFFLAKGEIPNPSNLLLSISMSYLAGIVLVIFQASIGILAFKLQDCSSLFWIWQRCSFLFGGLLMPLEFYPKFMQKIALFLPFSTLISSPASLMFEVNFQKCVFLFFRLLFWLFVGLITSWSLYKRALKSVKINGG